MTRRNAAAHTTIIEMLETTPAVVARPAPWSPAPEGIPDEDLDWEPGPLAHGFRSRRRFRWTVVLGATVVAAAAGFGWIRLLEMPGAAADARRAEYAAALASLAGSVPDLETAAARALDPSPGAATTALAPLVAADEAAGQTHELASAALPSTPPVLPGGIIATLRPARARLLEVSSLARSVTTQVRGVVAYRIAWDRSFLLPRLLRSATGAETAELDAALSVMLADSAAAVSELPDLPPMAGHRQMVADTMAWLPGWKSEYLTALRTGADERASYLVDDVRARLEQLDSAFGLSLAESAAEVTAAITELHGRIELAAVAVGG